MTIQEQLQLDLKEAMKARDKLRVEVIRTARAALQNAQLEAKKQQYDAAIRDLEARLVGDSASPEAALAALKDKANADQDGITPYERATAALQVETVPLDAEAQQAVITREVKRRREAADLYKQNGQMERSEQEEAEARILEQYLPRQLSADELRPQVAALISELGLHGPAAMGKLMPVLMERFKGQADGRVLSQLARELLSQS